MTAVPTSRRPTSSGRSSGTSYEQHLTPAPAPRADRGRRGRGRPGAHRAACAGQRDAGRPHGRTHRDARIVGATDRGERHHCTDIGAAHRFRRPRRSCTSTTGTSTSPTDPVRSSSTSTGSRSSTTSSWTPTPRSRRSAAMARVAATTSPTRRRHEVQILAADDVIQTLDQTLIPNLKNLSADWKNPAYDPGNKYSVPNYWWTTGYAWNPDKVPGDLSSWTELWDASLKGHLSMLDDSREVFAVAAFRLGLDPNTTNPADLDQMLNLLEQQKPLLRKFTEDDIGDLTSGQVWITHAWSGDWWQMLSGQAEDASTSSRPRGPIRGTDTMVVLSGAKHPIAAHLWIDFNLDAQVSAANTNYIGYMGPNAAAQQNIDPTILGDPRLNPPAVLDQARRAGATSPRRPRQVHPAAGTSSGRDRRSTGRVAAAERPDMATATTGFRRSGLRRRHASSAGPIGARSGAGWRARSSSWSPRAWSGWRSSSSLPLADHRRRQPRLAATPGPRHARRTRASTTTRQAHPTGVPARLRQLAALRGDHDRPVARSSATRSPTGSRATAAAARSCC